MKTNNMFNRGVVAALSLALALGSAAPAIAADSILGNLETSGDVWIASGGGGWKELDKGRPVATGDRLRTGTNGYAIADLGDQGVLGLFADTQVRATQSGGGVAVAVESGKVAFHIAEGSPLSVVAADSLISSEKTPKGQAAHGYVEIADNGDAAIVLEDGAAAVVVDGEVKRVRGGERLLVAAIGGGAAAGAVASATSTEDDDDKAAGIVRGGAAAGGGAAVAGAAAPVSAAAIGVGALAVVAAGAAIGSSGGDSNGSP